MIKKLISLSIYHPVAVISILLAASLWGLFSCFTISSDFIPKISERKIILSTKYEGLSPQDMEQLVTRVLEEGLAPMKGLKSTSSVTRSGLSLVQLELHWGTDMDLALVECRELVDLCYSRLPSQCEKPQVSLASSLDDAMMIGIIPKDSANLGYHRYWVEKEVRGRFQRLEACGGVKLTGGQEDEVHVLVDYDKMEAKRLSLRFISDKLASSNFQYPAGTIKEGKDEFLVKTFGLYENFQEMEKTPLLYDDLGLVKLSDVADVTMGSKDRESFFLYQGKAALCLSLSKAPDASPVVLSQQVQGEIEELRRQYGSHYDFIVLKDLSREVTSSLLSLGISCLVGLFVAAAIILYFLRCWKVSVLLSSLIPLCGLVVVLVLNLAGKSLNLMSLCGLAVGIGMVVDAGAVVLENLNRKILLVGKDLAFKDKFLKDKFLKDKSLKIKTFEFSGKDKGSGDRFDEIRPIIVDSVREVALSNTSSALTTAAVFLPLFFLKGLMGELFSDLALAVIASILASCLLSLSYIPAVYQFILQGGGENHKNLFLEKVEVQYGSFLKRLLEKKKLALVPVVACLGITVISLLFLDYRLLPEVQEDRIQAQVVFPFGTSLNRMEEVAGQIYSNLEAAGLQDVAIFGGLESGDYEGLLNPQQNRRVLKVMVQAPKDGNWTGGGKSGEKLDRRLLEKLLAGRNLKLNFLENQDILSRILQMSGNSYILSLQGSKEDRLVLDEVAEKLTKPQDGHLGEELPQEGHSLEERARHLVFKPDRLAASRFATNTMVIAQAARDLTAGVVSAPFYKEGRSIPMRVQLSSGHNLSATDLSSLHVQLDQLRLPLHLLGSFKEEPTQEILYRYNGQPAVILQNLNAEKSESLLLGKPVKLESLQQMERKEMMGNGVALLVVALLLLYFIMGAQLESFLIPLLLLVSLPPAFGGALFLTCLSGHFFSMNTVIALVVLFGTAVNNGILLYESILSQGGFTLDGILLGTAAKLRTILVTNFTTIFALIPFALIRSSSQSSLAVAIVGGLSFSMVLVLVVLPVVFALYGKLRGKIHG